MTAKIILRKEVFEVKHGMTIRMALKKLEIQSKAVLPTKNGELTLRMKSSAKET